MNTNQMMIGIGLIVALAVSSQILASRLRIPALIILLPAGFIAGAITPDVNPEKLLGPVFEPLVTLAVAVILYDAGLELDLEKLRGHTRKVVIRLIVTGVALSWALTSIYTVGVMGLSRQAALMTGAILVVSGPTVVTPLLDFIKPSDRLRHLLAWEGSLIDPVGAILSAVLFHALAAGSSSHGGGARAFVASVGVGLAGGVVGITILWALLQRLRLPETLATSAQLAVVVAIAAACNVARADSGLIAAIMMGLAVSNAPGFDLPVRRPFFETLVQLVIGLLFVSIAATITPSSLSHLVLPTLGLVAVLVLLARPLAAFLSTVRTSLSASERRFVGWMAPRGIVAAATASTFSAGLVSAGIPGASKILPITFLVIVATVIVYGLTADRVARLLGVAQARLNRLLIVGGDPWAVDLGRAIISAGLDVVMWAGEMDERERIRKADLPLAPGSLLAAATGEGSRLEGISAVCLMTREDDFNALGSVILRTPDGPRVYRLSPPPGDHGVIAPYAGGEQMFGNGLTRSALNQRYRAGARIGSAVSDGSVPAGFDLLFVIDHNKRLSPVTDSSRPAPQAGDMMVLLSGQTS